VVTLILSRYCLPKKTLYLPTSCTTMSHKIWAILEQTFWLRIAAERSRTESSVQMTPFWLGETDIGRIKTVTWVKSGDYRVARWYIFKPRIPIRVNFGGSSKSTCWYNFWPFGLFYGYLVNFVVIGYIFHVCVAMLYVCARKICQPCYIINTIIVINNSITMYKFVKSV
jgi:hypothetical protein